MVKILAIDDDVRLLKVYGEILSPLGCDVDTAEDPLSAIAKYNKTKPDLIILDIKMPAGGGLKVFETLRSQFADPTPIIFATALPREKLGSALKASKVYFLQKPFSKKQLLSKIRECLFGKIPEPPKQN